MILGDVSLKVSKYKCFGNKHQGFDKILPINVIIGKNNSGKSTLLDLIKSAISPESLLPREANVILSVKITAPQIQSVFPANSYGGALHNYINHYEYGKKFIDSKISFQLDGSKKHFIGTELKIDVPEVVQDFKRLGETISNPFHNLHFLSIAAERNIIPEGANFNSIDTKPDGSGMTNLVSGILNKIIYDSKLIEKKLLDELNNIIKPDIEFTDIITQLNNDSHWEINFEIADGTRIALSKMGSGIKTILQVLLNTIVIPNVQNLEYPRCVFAFEELENNLHPSMQRRLFKYLINFSQKHNSIIFITTHSNVVIDIFSDNPSAQILHVKKELDETIVYSTQSFSSHKQILDDLEIKASDILQSNGVIWVEGPSDRNYLNRWLTLLEPKLKEGFHYSIMFYGGRLLSNLCFDYEWLQEELIPLLRINTNSFVMIDKDGKRVSDKLNSTKTRIQQEIGENNCWITKGREIENYLTSQTLENWLLNKHNIDVKVKENKDEKIENNLSNSLSNIKLKYSSNKSIYSNEIRDYITVSDLDILDLKSKMKALVDCIWRWNK
jgi:putative ATP-dependent endonuclease of OLD family